jgi:hypothetical protein
MTRRSWVYIDGQAYEKGVDALPEPVAPMVMPDIEPYQSMADGSIIKSRSQHREHLRRHNCVEVGNEALNQMAYYAKIPKDVAPQQRKEIIRAQVDAMTQKQFKAAIKRDADFVKWNSRDG